ncbi:hypothetical protein A2631_02480 [Candidatus Daviesbacteria bacterium RIFCSPHIGHO2_01_FULL_44_29]|uniref:Methyltransferase domain-containing protein n=1 Tax=Candidatus Daviesbacteria bacterium RIFCSPHIGHO2_02_FULL_43_12 TaxID=1797776 RepID=A0A1F5KK50_9BACT|nr:MAG: hypothetical protein A2631_02480 [Candidatus Daviesbacteria bacterium RIFCSPHIGHO2_01_FULL_44_29]OGE40192.1 MAG: hypothetical protein A3E86_04425 [Candidatus Daviesbacteria bacterium RIFCSPHIGHO2_12_FULL_47_45]OGE41254.1 MAG: hypothetical protein A3D25_01875 [Candidatus Daviesbacteria bacterium RIFCSPHIGHO2_02_FULL_43_12]OGE69455.1 MAG: hypothetical protein A3B55_03615 [Candidatus Daviesbacteria bacterium RIFCSPLOWO2_01_FULL_43_15]
MNINQKKVLGYYKSLESKLGYEYITKKVKHFGYYPEGQRNISEHEAQQLMSDLVAKYLRLKPNQMVLDAGCGYGVVACYLAEKSKVNIVGLDLNSYEIGKARGRARKLNLEGRVKFEIMDYSRTSFTKNTFDAIFTLETLSHAAELKKTLRQFLNILKPNGKVVFFEYTLAPEKDFTSRELEMLNLGIEGTAALGLKEFKHDQFGSYLKKIGFKNIKERNITKNMLPSLQRLRRIALLPYFLIKLFNLQRYFVNTTIAVEWYELMKKGLIRYCIFTAEK